MSLDLICRYTVLSSIRVLERSNSHPGVTYLVCVYFRVLERSNSHPGVLPGMCVFWCSLFYVRYVFVIYLFVRFCIQHIYFIYVVPIM